MNNSTNNSGFLKTLYRGLPVVLFTMLAGIYIAKTYLKYATPLYESTAKIKLADTHEGIADSKLYKDLDVFASSNKIGAEVELLKSTVLVRKAISSLPLKITVYRIGKLRKTELYTQSPILIKADITNPKCYDVPFEINISRNAQVELKTATGKSIKSAFGRPIAVDGASFVFYKNDAILNKKDEIELNDHYQFIVHSQTRLISSIIDGLDIMAVDKDIPVLRISYKCPVPQKAADVVNSLSAAYITDYIDQKYKSADTTVDFLNKQLKTYSGSLAASENDIENYRNQNSIVNIPQETETDLRKIADLKKQLANVKMNLNAIDSLNRYIRTGKEHFLELAPNFEEFTDLLSTEMVKKIGDLQREKKDLLLKYTPENEKVTVVDNKLKDITDYLQESIKNTENSLRVKYHGLQQSIDESEKVFTGLPGREKNMNILSRNFGLNDQIYRFLHEKRTDAQIARAATISFHRVISEGNVPEKPVSPNSIIITILATILGMFAGIFLVYMIHSIKGRVNDQDTINRLSDTAIAASVPHFKKHNEIARFFKGWVLQMELKGELVKGSVITVSSFNKLEGKSFIAGYLQQEMELLDNNVLLINAEKDITGDLHKPSNWKKHIESLKTQFDTILINNFSLADQSAGAMLMATANLNLFVLDSRRTKKTSVEDADILKGDLKLPNMQFVLNRAGYIPSLLTQAKEILKKIKK